MSLLLLSLAQAGFSQSKYIKKYRPLADSLSLEFGIPAAVLLGVAILESSSGTSRNCKLLHNHFGIVGKNKLLKEKGIRTRYKQYKKDEDSYEDFCKLVKKKKYYKKLKGTTDPKPWIEAISKSAYSEVPATWKKRVLDTIRRNKLSATR
jgi:flagellum-specific peptidoglycan hydrolase FlgJ